MSNHDWIQVPCRMPRALHEVFKWLSFLTGSSINHIVVEILVKHTDKWRVGYIDSGKKEGLEMIRVGAASEIKRLLEKASKDIGERYGQKLHS